MQAVKFYVTSPVRTAQTDEHKFVLYNTHNFRCIYVGDSSYKLWNFLCARRELTAQEIGDYLLHEFQLQGKTDEEAFLECKGFLDFLAENGFVREASA